VEVHIFNPSAWETEARESWAGGQPGEHVLKNKK
jgi:hypothetical protein